MSGRQGFHRRVVERPRSDGLWWGSAADLPAAAEGAKRRVLDGGLVIARQRQLHEAEKVLEHLGITLYASLPVFVDAALENLLGVGYVARVGFGVVVVCLPSEIFEVPRVGFFSPLGKHAEVRENVVLRVSPCPFPTLRHQHVSMSQRGARYGKDNLLKEVGSPYLLVRSPHHLTLGMVNGRL